MKEGIQEFAVDTDRLSRLAYKDLPQTAVDVIAIQNFTTGLENTDMALWVSSQNLTKYWDVVGAALRYEALQATIRHTARIRKIQVEQDDKRNEVEERRQKYQPTRTVKCYQCGKLGHIKARWPENEKRQENNTKQEN
ncbi:hypothetical protein CBL_01723 [Carabus blaptoides fortunei]